MKKRYSEEQIIGFLREAETGVQVRELFHGMRMKLGAKCEV